MDQRATDSVEGNAWIIVPIRDAFYAGIYDYLRAGEPCHTLDTGSIANLYDSDKSFGKRVDKEPLKSWVAESGDTVYFMVSGLAKDDMKNVEERSDIIKVTLDDEGVIVEAPCSEDPTGPHCPGQCNVPDRSDFVRQVARNNPDQLQAAHQLNLNRTGNGAQSALAVYG